MIPPQVRPLQTSHNRPHPGPPAPTRLFLLAAGWVVSLAGLAASLQAAPPTLSHLFPAGGQRGTKVTITASGSFTWPVQVWAPGIEAVPTADSGKIDITIPADLPADRVWLRLFSAEGASATFPFQVGTLPEVLEKEPNNSPKTAQKLEGTSLLVNGVLEGADVDSFAVELQAGQTLVAAVEANTALGSPMDAMLQVVSPRGFVLAENNDDIHLDPRLAYTAPQAGLYIVRLFAFPSTPGTNIAYAGGANFVYRLTLTTGPYITHALPLSAPLPATDPQAPPATIEVTGWNLPLQTRVPLVKLGTDKLPFAEFDPIDDLRNASANQVGLGWGPGIANSARVRLTSYNTVPQIHSGDPQQPVVLKPSSVAMGWLRTKGQADTYTVPLTKGQPVLFSVESRTLNLLVDPVLVLTDPTGAKVAEVDDTGPTQDCAVAHTAAHDGDYKLTVRDRYAQFGERCVYRVTARLEQTDFELNLAADTVTIEPGKPTELVVKVVRRTGPEGALGPITVEIPSLPPGVTCAAVVSEPTGPTAGEVKLSLSADGPAVAVPIRIAGKTAQPAELQRFARTPARLGATSEALWLTVLEKKAQ